MKEAQYNWDKLWELFEQLILESQDKHAKIILNSGVDDENMLRELKDLLNAHYSESNLLDSNPSWHSDFKQAFKPPKQIHGYKIEEKLGSGGIGDVYLASKTDDGFERKVAIKFATTGRFSTHILNSFNRELEILLSLNHVHIERLYDGGITKDNIPFLIVEYIDGVHINQYCDLNKLNLNQRLVLFQKICMAVDAVHRSLIVHRDIKAGNIMVNSQGEPKLLDFGLAKLIQRESPENDDSQTVSSLMMTIAYASPEQINGGNITTASDIYSLGILLYYLLTGKLPYKVESNNLSAAIEIITQFVPKLVSKNISSESAIQSVEANLSRKLSGDIEQIVAKSIAKQPERRYLSAVKFAEDIQNFLDNRPVVAKKDSVLYRSKKFIQRHVFGVMLSSLAVISLLALTVVLFIQSKNLKQSIREISLEQKRVVQVTAFLKDMFKVSDPLVTDAKIIQVKDLLDYSSQRLDSQFNQEPMTKATLYETLGNVYLNMSLLEQAEPQFKKADELFKSQNNGEGMLRMYLARTRLLQQQGKLQEAQDQTNQLLKQFQFEQLGKEVQAEIEVFQGQNYYQLGDFVKAKQLLKSGLKKRIELFGEEHSLVVDIYQLLGNVYWRLGDFEQVEYYYSKSYSLNKAQFGETHHKTIKSRSALGVLAYAQGDYVQSLAHFQHVANARLSRLGDTHILTASAFNRLGATYFEAGQYDLAEANLTKALDIFNNLNLSESMKYARTLNNLGLVERQSQHYQKAQQIFLKAKAIEVNNLGETHIDVAGMNNNLGMVAADLGEIDKALSLFVQAYTVMYQQNQLKNANIAFSMTNIGRMYLELSEVEKAQDWIVRA